MSVQVKIGGETYSAEVYGKVSDMMWDGRMSKTITLEMTHDVALETFKDDVAWSIVVDEVEYNNSEYCIAGDVTDHRDGTVSVKMGKPTDLEEAYELLYGGE